MTGTQGRVGVLIQGAAVLVALAILLGLGTWQVERKAWKEALIATLTNRIAENPMPLPPPGKWAQMEQQDWEFRRVKLTVTFGNGGDVLAYTSGSALRDDVKSPGYFVFAPASLQDGKKIVVNCGYVPSKSYPHPQGTLEIVGTLRWPEAPLWFISAHDADGAVWYVRDQTAMAHLKGWGIVAPFYLEQEAPVPAGGLPHPAPLKVKLINNHLQYAITWYGLAVALVVVSAVFMLRRRRDQGPDSSAGRY